MEPPHSYLREHSASVLHHADYLTGLDDHALCGATLQNPAAVSMGAADALCPDCEARLTVYHLKWWRKTAIAATEELEALRVRYRELEERTGTARPAPAAEPADHSSAAAADNAEPEPTTYLGRARRELDGLVAQFEESIPFFRLKNAMQEFSDRLEDHERELLAREIGSDSSLIRWATTEVESRGLTVTNNRVQKNEDMMWQEWLQESQPAPKTKKRFGRSR